MYDYETARLLDEETVERMDQCAFVILSIEKVTEETDG